MVSSTGVGILWRVVGTGFSSRMLFQITDKLKALDWFVVGGKYMHVDDS